MADDVPSAAPAGRVVTIQTTGDTGQDASDVERRLQRLRLGDALSVTFTHDALRYGRSLDIRRGAGVLFHLVVRPTQGTVIANDHDGKAWGSDHSLTLAHGQAEDTITLHIAFETEGALVQLSDGRTMVFDRFRPDGAEVEFVVPPGIMVSPATASEARSSFDLSAWLGREAKDRSVAELGSLAGQPPGSLPMLALRQGASAVTLVDVAPLVAPAWLPLQDVPGFAASLGKRAYMLQASWADPDLSEQVGLHDIVLCHAILPHAADPLRLLLELRAMTKRSCFLSVPIVPDMIEGEHGVFDIASIGAVFLPTAAPALLASLQAAAPGTAGPSEPWIDRGECNPQARWWAMTRRHVEGLVALAGFRATRSLLTEGSPQSLGLLLDVA